MTTFDITPDMPTNSKVQHQAGSLAKTALGSVFLEQSQQPLGSAVEFKENLSVLFRVNGSKLGNRKLLFLQQIKATSL